MNAWTTTEAVVRSVSTRRVLSSVDVIQASSWASTESHATVSTQIMNLAHLMLSLTYSSIFNENTKRSYI